MSRRDGRAPYLSMALLGFGLGMLVAAGVAWFQFERKSWPFAGLSQSPSLAPPSNERQPARAEPLNPPGHSLNRADLVLDEQAAQAADLRSSKVERHEIEVPLRAAAVIVPDESRVTHIHSRITGWIERLYINTTGQAVRAGEPIASVFSQEIYATQAELLSALHADRHAPPSAVADAARTRLRLLGVTDAELAEIERSGTARRLVTLVAPHGGVVIRRGVSAGTSIDPATEIATIADLSRVWAWAEIPESAISQVEVGSRADLEFPGPNLTVSGARLEVLYPTLTERTRTVRGRFVLDNPHGALRPGLYGTATFAGVRREALMIPRDAVVDSGRTQHVFVQHEKGHIEPRQVTLGARLAEQIEIVDGLAPGESVLVSGVFMLDSESRLRASGGAGTGHAAHGGASRAPAKEGEVSTAPSASPAPSDEHSVHGH